DMVKYWMHCNMITIGGQKMGKSLGNFITLGEFFTGHHEKLTQAYSPMTVRFFILQAHYRSTVDFSNDALQAAEKGLQRLMTAIGDIKRIVPAAESDAETHKVATELCQRCYDAMNDDLASPTVISHLFEAASTVNRVLDHKGTISQADLDELAAVMHLFAEDILGLQSQAEAVGGSAAREEAFGAVVDMLLEQRAKAKAAKDWATSDLIRDRLATLGFVVKDTKDGATWTLNR
ncbi:MAG: cysteine--tRNA ligase, partial [Bacteroidaceae bacterium]|nr:cysteine--tRNA ligase [Bacteroidaceae bacterium]